MPRLGIDVTFSSFGLQKCLSIDPRFAFECKTIASAISSDMYNTTDLEILNENLGVSWNVLTVLIIGNTGDKVQTVLLPGEIGTGGELAFGNECAPPDSVNLCVPNNFILFGLN